MTRHAMSLMDVLAPPGNGWLKDLSRRKTDLPAGVKIVRFSDGDDEFAEKDETPKAKRGRLQSLAA
mgnify:FL=1